MCHGVVNFAERNGIKEQFGLASQMPETTRTNLSTSRLPVCEAQAPCFTEDVMKGFPLRLLSLLLLLTASAYAVEVTARIKGTVTDPTGAVLPNIKVTATNQDTGVTITTTSLANGDYIFQKLPIGTYSVSATSSGFVHFPATGIVLNIDQEYVLPIKLTI